MPSIPSPPPLQTWNVSLSKMVKPILIKFIHLQKQQTQMSSIQVIWKIMHNISEQLFLEFLSETH
jgi:hypothetical protein